MMGISRWKVEQAEKILIDNGIEKDEAPTVLQALGYALMDTELYPKRHTNATIRVWSGNLQHGDDTPLFFLDITRNMKNSDVEKAATAEILSRLESWYGDTDQDTEDWVLEYALWARMLLQFSERQPISIMLNPSHLDIQEMKQRTALMEYVAFVGGFEAAGIYKAVMENIPAVRQAWENEGKEECFTFTVKEGET